MVIIGIATNGRNDMTTILKLTTPALEVGGPTATTPGPFVSDFGLLRQAIESGQVSAAQVAKHHAAGEYDPARKRKQGG